jgi:RNA polymerase sigma-70 factor (TIGR02960 family)
VTDWTLGLARAGDEQAFRELTDPYRRELQLHCYRILGSVQDAEDMLQETLLAAWRGLERFEERASVRAWLYRIATNRCLNALRATGRRPQGQPPEPPFTPSEPTRRVEPVWLQPYPDILLDGIEEAAPGPEARYEAKETIALAFVAAIAHLPPRQRAVLLLRDVLGFRAAEVADMLDSSEASVNSALQRARATLEARLPGAGSGGSGGSAGARPGGSAAERVSRGRPLPRSPRDRELVEQFATAFQEDDIDGLVRLLTDDAWLTMPPATLEYQGRAAITAFLLEGSRWRSGRTYRLVPTSANGQPAFGCYLRDPQAPIFHAHGLIVLTLSGDQISAVTRFIDNAALAQFGFPRTLRD